MDQPLTTPPTSAADDDYPSIDKAGRLSAWVWRHSSRVMQHAVANGLNAFCKLVRPGRVMMVTLLTWVAAGLVKLSAFDTTLITLSGMCLAMAGFAADVYADREVDRVSPRAWPINPISTDMMSAETARLLIAVFVVAGLGLAFTAHPLSLLPALALLVIYWGLTTGAFNGPIGRTVTLGLLQALYVMLAAAASGSISLFMILVASVLFISMSGARAGVDIRDLPSDLESETRSLPKAYGVKTTSLILPVAITLAFALSLALYPVSPFDSDYLLWTCIGFSCGTVMAWGFWLRPTPNLAFMLSLPFWATGILYMCALYFGSR